MAKEKISNINKKTLLSHPEKYLRIEVEEEFFNENFKKLLTFIEDHSYYGRTTEFGNAFKRIKIKTDQLLGIQRGTPCYVKTSKPEIRSILQTKGKKNHKKYIRIPYKISYIFKAIIFIIEEIKVTQHIDIPDELKNVYDFTYKMAFYNYHIDCYDNTYIRLREQNLYERGYKTKCELNNDFHSENSIFNTKFGR